MGGLIFGAAQLNGYCQLDATSSWCAVLLFLIALFFLFIPSDSRYAVGMPANGSRVVDLLEGMCTNSSSFMRLIVDKRMADRRLLTSSDSV